MDQQLKDLVIQEAKNLLVYATQEERMKLDFKKLNAQYSDRCVYGQMTGTCLSRRAHNLIKRCCKRVYSANGHFDHAKLNGKPTEIRDWLDYPWYSPIEVYIYKNDANNMTLLQFLRSEITEEQFSESI